MYNNKWLQQQKLFFFINAAVHAGIQETTIEITLIWLMSNVYSNIKL